MDESHLEAWEKAALDGGNARFLSKPDEKHEFDHLATLDMIQLRANWISLHRNPMVGPGEAQLSAIDDRIPEAYRHAFFLIHSERGRLKHICDLIMRTWLMELPLVVHCLSTMEAGEADDELQWEAESIGLEVLSDSYRVGLITGGGTPTFVAKDLLIDLLIFICRAAADQADARTCLGYQPGDLLQPLRVIRESLPDDESAAAES